MKTRSISAVLIASLLLAGCDKKASPLSSTPSAAAPVAQPMMTTWQQGDQSTAVISFVETDWSSRPLFASSSTLSLSEDQFKALSDAERQGKSGEMFSQLDSLKQLAAAAAQAGHDAASKSRATQAPEDFT